MKLEERNGDVLKFIESDESLNNNFYLVHCISADFSLSAGIADQINRKFKVKDQLKEKYGEFNKKVPDCLVTTENCNIFHLVTKKFKYNKPTYNTLQDSLEICKKYCEENDIKYLAMPKIGCGLDKLQWNHVYKKIKKVFNSLDILILVFDLN